MRPRATRRLILWTARRAKAACGAVSAVTRGLVQPGTRVALRVAEPAQNVVSFVERFPRYRVA
jgi:hypothetical protein